MEAELRKLGVTRLSHLVIPDHHRKAPLAGDPFLLEWLREREIGGDEMVLHGYYHLREQPARKESAWDRLVTRSYTAGEGEFYDLPAPAARERLERGLADLRAAGLAPEGFIAPAWLLGEAAESAVRDLGLRYTTRIGYVRDYAAGRDYAAQSLCWSVRSAWRRQASLRWNDYLLAREHRAPLVRIGLHPVDIAHPQIWAQIRRLVQSALESREPRTYAEFCRTHGKS
jgi:predicted deacetylase